MTAQQRPMKFLSQRDLFDRGITFSRQHLAAMVKEGRFPRPVKFGDSNRWLEEEIEAWMRARVEERDKKKAPPGGA